MTKFEFIKYKTNKKIRVLFKNPKSDIFVVFLHGLKSDLTGKKPNYLMKPVSYTHLRAHETQ